MTEEGGRPRKRSEPFGEHETSVWRPIILIFTSTEGFFFSDSFLESSYFFTPLQKEIFLYFNIKYVNCELKNVFHRRRLFTLLQNDDSLYIKIKTIVFVITGVLINLNFNIRRKFCVHWCSMQLINENTSNLSNLFWTLALLNGVVFWLKELFLNIKIFVCFLIDGIMDTNWPSLSQVGKHIQTAEKLLVTKIWVYNDNPHHYLVHGHGKHDPGDTNLHHRLVPRHGDHGHGVPARLSLFAVHLPLSIYHFSHFII